MKKEKGEGERERVKWREGGRRERGVSGEEETVLVETIPLNLPEV